jgi:hypothetical protein
VAGNPAGSDTQIQYNNGGSAFGGCAQLYWDDVNNRLGLNVASPSYPVHVSSTDNHAIYGTTSAASSKAGVMGEATGGGSTWGVYGKCTNETAGVLGASLGTGAGVTGLATVSGYGIVASAVTTDPVKSAIRIVPQAPAPTTSAEGDIYVNSSDHKFYYKNNSSWVTYRLSTEDHTHQSTGAQGGLLDHGLALAGSLADDDHTQYALLAGRASSQTLKGGTAASETLTLMSTAHATKGKILFGTSAYDEVNNSLGLANSAPDATLDVTGSGHIHGSLVVYGGKLGIGTSPSHKVHVDNTTASTYGLYVATNVADAGYGAIFGYSTDTGSSTNVFGVLGRTDSTYAGSRGVHGAASAGYGGYFESNSGSGLCTTSTSGWGLTVNNGGISCTGKLLQTSSRCSDYTATFRNTYGDASAWGIAISCGTNITSKGTGYAGDCYWIGFFDNEGFTTSQSNWIAGIQYTTSTPYVQFITSSDERQKKNIKPTSVKALSLIRSLELVSFDWKTRNLPSQSIGYIAQQVQKVIPDMVSYDSKADEYRVGDGILVKYLVKAIQELADQVDALKLQLSVC